MGYTDQQGGIGEAGLPVPAENPRWRALTDEEVEKIAAFVHSANRMYQAMNGEDPAPPWPEASDLQKDGIRKGVSFVLLAGSTLKRALSSSSEAEDSHNSWMEDCLRAGWTYGTVKDEQAKTHPCLLPYRALPDWQRRKDVLFRALCEALDPRREV